MATLLELTSQGDVGTISDESQLAKVKLMTPQQLYELWERQPWQSQAIDLAKDVADWAALSEEERAEIVWLMSSFFLGEERVTVELLPFAIAAPTHEAKVFLTTQISDEAKHTVFWNGFYREVFGVEADGLGEMIDKQRYVVNKDWETLFDGILHECAEDLRKDPSDFPKLVRGITVYMIVIEGMLALTAARFMIKSMRERGWFPGFTAGFTAVNRDESRHVGFGVKFLADAIKADQANARVVEDTLKECLAVAPLVFVPPWVDDPYNFQTPFYHSSEIFEYAAKSLSKKLAAMGLDPAMLATA